MSTVRSVYSNLKAARSAIKDLGRLRQIAVVLIRHGFGHIVEAIGRQNEGLFSELLQRRGEGATPIELSPSLNEEERALTLYERIPLILQELGPTFVKLGQILSTRQDLIPLELCLLLQRLQDDVTALPDGAAREVIEGCLEAPLESLFESFEEAPLACASIAQVHCAVLKSGEEVVVKVQRPGARETIEADLHILHFLARQVEDAVPEAAAFNPSAIIREFERAISRELDFHFEARNLKRFEGNFRAWERVHIPHCYPSHSRDRVLTMERLRGVKITEAAEVGHEMKPIAEEAVRMVFKQVFEDGFFHGDLHPGNLLVLEDGRIGLIDFGLVGRMSAEMRERTADLFLHIITQHYEGVARVLYDISLNTKGVDYRAWEGDVIDLMELHFSTSSLAEIDFGQLIGDLIDGAIRHQVQIPPDYAMFFKAVMTVEGIGKIVSPDLDLLQVCRPYVEALIARRYRPEQLFRLTIDTLQAFGRLGRRLPQSLQHVMQQIEERQLGLQLSDAQLERRQAAQRRLINRSILAALSIALWAFAISLSLGESQLEWAQGLRLFCLISGGWIGARLLWRINGEGW